MNLYRKRFEKYKGMSLVGFNQTKWSECNLHIECFVNGYGPSGKKIVVYLPNVGLFY